MYDIQTETACLDCAASKNRADVVQKEFEDFKVRVRARMIQEAEARDWCSEFDRILQEFGLEPRDRPQNFNVYFDVSGRVCVTVIARNEEHAVELAENGLGFYEDTMYQLGRTSRDIELQSISCDYAEPEDC